MEKTKETRESKLYSLSEIKVMEDLTCKITYYAMSNLKCTLVIVSIMIAEKNTRQIGGYFSSFVGKRYE